MTRRIAVVAAVLLAGVVAGAGAQPPDGNAVLRGAGVDLPRGGAPVAFDMGIQAPEPIPPTAFATLLVGMGPVGNAARIRNAYAFGVLAGRSARAVPPGPLAGAGVALLQMLVADHRPTRIAGMRVAGRVFAAPVDGGAAPMRPDGLAHGLVLLLDTSNKDEEAAAMEAVGLVRETSVVPALIERFRRYRERGDREMATAALEALARIGDPRAAEIAGPLAADPWASRDDATGLVWAFARERFLKDGSATRLRAALEHRSLGPRARDYLLELGLQP